MAAAKPVPGHCGQRADSASDRSVQLVRRRPRAIALPRPAEQHHGSGARRRARAGRGQSQDALPGAAAAAGGQLLWHHAAGEPAVPAHHAGAARAAFKRAWPPGQGMRPGQLLTQRRHAPQVEPSPTTGIQHLIPPLFQGNTARQALAGAGHGRDDRAAAQAPSPVRGGAAGSRGIGPGSFRAALRRASSGRPPCAPPGNKLAAPPQRAAAQQRAAAAPWRMACAGPAAFKTAGCRRAAVTLQGVDC